MIPMIKDNNENTTNDEVKDTMIIIYGAPLDPIIMLCDPLKLYYYNYM